MNCQYVYGLHAVTALLHNPHRIIKKLFINQDRIDKKLQDFLIKAEPAHIPIEKLTAQQMQKRFVQWTHQGIVAVVSKLPEYNETDLLSLLNISKKPVLILILDGITDPHNLGACLRSADATGVNFVVIPKDKSANITPVVSKVACGAVESIPIIRVTNLVRAIEMLKQQDIWIYGADDAAEQSLYKMNCAGAIAIVMGAEGKGLRQLTRKNCDGLFSLPMLGSVSSLNVSVATGVSLYEVIRQRGQYHE